MDKQYQHRDAEKQLAAWWQKEQVYAVAVSGRSPLFSIDTPPPTVSGALHIGHIFSYTQTDIMARYARLKGHPVWYPFGFDDNGLPTERFIEKTRGVSAHQKGRTAFIQLCLSATVPVEDAFKQLWQRMGLSVDWNNSYATIDARTRAISQTSFIRLYEKGYVYRKEEPSLYCTGCRTAVAQAELDDEEQHALFYELAFLGSDGKEYCIATTRPELLPGCVALLYHPSDVRYAHLAGLTARVPLFDYAVPFVADELVIPTKGTGLVMCCTFGDTLDIEWYKKHSFPYRPVIGADGKWLPSTGLLAGKNKKEAQELLITALQDKGLVRSTRELVHTVNVHERCKLPVEFLVISQWFLKILPYKKELIAVADTIEWYPAFMKSRYVNWVEQITWDWCLSRQRFFGIPFPVWHCTACQTIHLPCETALPLDPQEVAWKGTCTHCGENAVVPDRDVMDTWNTSSLTPYLCRALLTGSSNVFDEPFEPMTLRPQAHDIIRTWAFYTIVKVWMHHQTVPWKQIVISGHVLAPSGGKLSKSKQHTAMDPEQLLERYPADVIRFWTASGSLGHDTVFSEQQLQIGNRLVVKLWNALRFIAEHEPKPFGPEIKSSEPTSILHRWIATCLTQAYNRSVQYLEQHEVGAALAAVDSCFWKDFCETYLELVKDQFFHPEHYSAQEREETRNTLARSGLIMLQLYAPYLPYITEKLYQELYRGVGLHASLHRTTYEQVMYNIEDKRAVEYIALVNRIVHETRKAKTGSQLSLKTTLVRLEIEASPQIIASLQNLLCLVRGATRAVTIICRQASSAEVTADVAILEEKADGWHMRLALVSERSTGEHGTNEFGTSGLGPSELGR